VINEKLFKIKMIKVNGVKFAVKQLSPSLFMDKNYMFPMTNVVEKAYTNEKINESEMLEQVENFKDKIKDALLLGIDYVQDTRFLIKTKKVPIDTYIEKIMINSELYSYLFSEIVNHSLGIKKKLQKYFKLTEPMPKPSIS